MAVDVAEITAGRIGIGWASRAAWAARGRFVPKIDAESHAIGVTGNYYH